MNIPTAAGIGILGIAALVYFSGDMAGAPKYRTPLGQVCQETLETTADLALRHVAEEGLTVPFWKQAFVGPKIRGTCQCADKSLGSELSEGEARLAGRLLGLKLQAEATKMIKDRRQRSDVRRQLTEEARALIGEHGAGLRESAQLARRVERTLVSCFRG